MKSKVLKTQLFSQITAILIVLTQLCSTTQAQDPPALHGMLMYGEGSELYLSHFPMFHAPHNYQVILKVSVDSETLKAYEEGRARGIHTLAPEPFILTEKSVPGATFRAQLFQGHFEQGGTYLRDTEVTVVEVTYFEELSTGHH